MNDKAKPVNATRRTFFALLGVGAAVVALGPSFLPEAERPRSAWMGKTRWIGHC